MSEEWARFVRALSQELVPPLERFVSALARLIARLDRLIR